MEPDELEIGSRCYFRIGTTTEGAPILRPAVVVGLPEGEDPQESRCVQVLTNGERDREALFAAGVLPREHAPVPPAFHVTGAVVGTDVGQIQLAQETPTGDPE